MTNHEKVAERKEEYRRKRSALMGQFITYHYKNTCSMVGTVGVEPNTEYLTGDETKVNCPFCSSYLIEQNRKKR